MHVHLSTVRGLKFDFFVDVLERFCLAIHLAAIPHMINISPDTIVYFFQDRLKISGGNEMNER